MYDTCIILMRWNKENKHFIKIDEKTYKMKIKRRHFANEID